MRTQSNNSKNIELLSSLDIANEKRNRLKQVFPEVFTENKIDFDQLKAVLGEFIETNSERYGLNWAGKSECMKIIQEPSVATLKPDRSESVDFDNTDNVYIEGENLEVLKLLQKSYFGKIKMIYIDPPYNTGKDFVYKDKFGQSLDDYLKLTGQVDAEGRKLSTNSETDGRYHSNWLNMMYPRLYLARNLLRDDGVIFISIDDHEVANLRSVCDQVFGEENFMGICARVSKKTNNKGDFWAPNFDYLITYAKCKHITRPFLGGVNYDAYNQLEEEGKRIGERYQLIRLYMSNIKNRNPEQRYFIECPDGSKVIPPGRTFPPERPILGDGIWRWCKKKFDEERDKIIIKKVKSSNLIDDKGVKSGWNVFTKVYLEDVIQNARAKPNSLIENYINELGSEEIKSLEIPFNYNKPKDLIKYLCEIAFISEHDIILDFFSGSATTAHAVMQLNAEDNGNRKYIMVQLPEATPEHSEARNAGYLTIADIGKERIRRAAIKIKEAHPEKSNLDLGFKVFKLDKSNFNIWDSSPDTDLQHQLELHTNPIDSNSSTEDILYELFLKSGLELTVPIDKIMIKDKTVFSVNNKEILICLEKDVTEELVEAIAKLKPKKAIFLDCGFNGNDQLKINAAEAFKILAQNHQSESVFMTI